MGKTRKTISLEPKHWGYLRLQAQRRGISIAKLIEYLIEAEITKLHHNAPIASDGSVIQ